MKPQFINALVRTALSEDVGSGDITSRLVIPSGVSVEATIVSRSSAVVCGLEVAREVFRQVDPSIRVQLRVKEGDKVKAGAVLMALDGPARSVLTAERTALNFLSYLSAVASRTRQFCDAVRGYKAVILDTRKTTPGLRLLERYAVRCGGGQNHRDGLYDMVLIKDNHRFLSRKDETLDQTVLRVRARTKKKIEIEVDGLVELREVLPGRPDIVLLDNMSPRDMRTAVALVARLPAGRRPLLEASGGITLGNVRAAAATGVDRISTGALTHSREAIDMSMEFIQ
jgi:nicotinate-nucleotide pyrophosphorylase (carboxylating)